MKLNLAVIGLLLGLGIATPNPRGVPGGLEGWPIL
jgi:hypothetical protein